jgi:hypothetical protein
MGQKKFKRLRKLANEMMKHAHTGTQSLPESYMMNGRRTLNPGKRKGAYKWLKKNAALVKTKSAT